jgi:hypothetical protein
MKHESRARELRQRLIVWKQTPESSRPTLRALGRELGVKHQLLGYYLDGLEKWQVEEAWRRAREFRAQAKADGRPMTSWEALQSNSLDRRAFCLSMEAGMNDSLKTWEREIEQAIKHGNLPAAQLPKMLRKIAASGNEKAQAMLKKYFSPEAQQAFRQQGLRRRTVGEDDPEWHLQKLISHVGDRGGILWLDDDGRVLYSIPSMDSKSRALMAKIWKHREEVKRILGDYVARLKKEGRYEEIRAKICQHFPPSTLTPLDQFKDMGKNSGNSARMPGKEGDK